MKCSSKIVREVMRAMAWVALVRVGLTMLAVAIIVFAVLRYGAVT